MPRRKPKTPEPKTPETTAPAPEVATEPAPPPVEVEVPPKPAAGEPQQKWQPDPFEMESITLGDERGDPRMRLYRNQRYSQMAIQFDERPDARYTKMLTDAGYRWRPVEKVWTHQLNPDARWRTQAEAEHLFRRIGNAIREDKGLGPVQGPGV